MSGQGSDVTGALSHSGSMDSFVLIEELAEAASAAVNATAAVVNETVGALTTAILNANVDPDDDIATGAREFNRKGSIPQTTSNLFERVTGPLQTARNTFNEWTRTYGQAAQNMVDHTHQFLSPALPAHRKAAAVELFTLLLNKRLPDGDIPRINLLIDSLTLDITAINSNEQTFLLAMLQNEELFNNVDNGRLGAYIKIIIKILEKLEGCKPPMANRVHVVINHESPNGFSAFTYLIKILSQNINATEQVAEVFRRMNLMGLHVSSRSLFEALEINYDLVFEMIRPGYSSVVSIQLIKQIQQIIRGDKLTLESDLGFDDLAALFYFLFRSGKQTVDLIDQFCNKVMTLDPQVAQVIGELIQHILPLRAEGAGAGGADLVDFCQYMPLLTKQAKEITFPKRILRALVYFIPENNPAAAKKLREVIDEI